MDIYCHLTHYCHMPHYFVKMVIKCMEYLG
uniref:Uncharacterized protein n=1 Tax=Anguilla anguilla TaxID=7936 RepID=A0A0E9Q8H0_ANGAN